MNLSAPPSPAAPRGSSAADPASCRRDDAPPQDACEAFERVLQARQRAPRDESQDTPSDEAPATAAMPPPIAQAQALVRSLAAAAGAGGIDAATGGTRASIQTALNSSPPPAAPGAADAASVWEASVRGPDQLSVDVRAERLSSRDAPPSWGLTIGSPALGADMLARHAPRLNERLRKHGVELDHVRIESSDDPSPR